MKKILITGASGLVGGNCLNYFKQFSEYTVVGTHLDFPTGDTKLLDLFNPDLPGNFNVKEYDPSVVIHCGALTNVDFCENNSGESYKRTVEATSSLLSLVNEGCKIIYISTDYIFDGANGPYDERSVPAPKQIYGKHKLQAEKIIMEEHSDYLIIRITGAYGKEIRRKNFVSRLMDNLTANDELEIKLPCDQFSTPINALDIAKALKLLIEGKKTGIYHLAGTDYLNRFQLGQMILKHYNSSTVKIFPVKTDDLKQPALRPLLGGLKTKKFLGEFPDFHFSNVDDFIAQNKNV